MPLFAIAMNESPFKGKTGLTRVWNAFHYSMAGLAAAYRNEDAFRQEVLLAAILIPVALVIILTAPLPAWLGKWGQEFAAWRRVALTRDALLRALTELGVAPAEAKTLSDAHMPAWPMERRKPRGGLIE